RAARATRAARGRAGPGSAARARTTLGAARLLRGGLPVALAAVVGDVEALPLEQEAGAAGEDPGGVRTAHGALGDRRVAHALEPLELVSLGTPVLVRRHRSTPSAPP